MVANLSRRVVVTGVGFVSPVGSSKAELWDALTTGKSGVARAEQLPADALPSPYVAEARYFTGHIDNFGPLEAEQKKGIRKGIKLMCREIQTGVAAAQMALADAGLKPGTYTPERIGCIYGSDYLMTLPDEFVEGVRSCVGDDKKFDFNRWAEEGISKVTPLWLLKYLPNMPASHVAIYNDLRGPNNSLTHREASGGLAIGEAACIIARGGADIMLAGATGTRVHPLRTLHVMLQEEIAINGLPPEKLSRPFDLNRTGMVLGEGAGTIVLEELESAISRGATILGEVMGFASSSVLDRNGTAFCDKALRNVMAQSLRSADMMPEELGHINAHGLSTRKSDRDEARAINEIFGARRKPIPVTTAKGHFGNLGAGSGMVELIGSLFAMQQGQLFPVLNYETPDPECPLNVVKSGSEVSPGDSVLSMNVTPQGQASAVLVRKYAG